jgi:hypothetical protein
MGEDKTLNKQILLTEVLKEVMVLRNTEVIYKIILVKNAIYVSTIFYVCIDKITHWRVAPSALIPLIPE